MNWRDNQMTELIVRWQDGSYDSSRTCDECRRADCQYPVHGNLTPEGDSYKEVFNGKKYWDWCHIYAEVDQHGTIIEPKLANVDSNGKDPNFNAIK